MSRSDSSSPAPDGATLTITRLPEGDLSARVLILANAAKSAAWHGGYEGEPLPDDSKFIRGALALVHLLEASEAGREAQAVVFLLAAEFEVHGTERHTPRGELLAAVLDDPNRVMVEAVQTNRRLLGMPPQLDLVSEQDGES